jgi:hypothetical protein
MPMFDAPGPRNEVVPAEAARLHRYDMSVRALLDAVRADRAGPPRRRDTFAPPPMDGSAPLMRKFGRI